MELAAQTIYTHMGELAYSQLQPSAPTMALSAMMDEELLPMSDEQQLLSQGGDDDQEGLEPLCGSMDSCSVASDISSDISLISDSSSPLKPIGRLAPGALTGVKGHAGVKGYEGVKRHDGVKPIGRLAQDALTRNGPASRRSPFNPKVEQQQLHAPNEQSLHAHGEHQPIHAHGEHQPIHAHGEHQSLHAHGEHQPLHAQGEHQPIHAQGELQLHGGALGSQGAGMPPPSSQDPAACSPQPSLQPPPISQDTSLGISHMSHQPVCRCIHHLIKLIMRTVEEEVAMFKGRESVTLTPMAIRTWLHSDADKT